MCLRCIFCNSFVSLFFILSSHGFRLTVHLIHKTKFTFSTFNTFTDKIYTYKSIYDSYIHGIQYKIYMRMRITTYSIWDLYCSIVSLILNLKFGIFNEFLLKYLSIYSKIKILEFIIQLMDFIIYYWYFS